MKIAYGNSRTSKKWVNKDIPWSEFCERIKNPVRTTETVAEFRKMSKSRQDEIKDVGGYVFGHLKEGKRKSGNILCRSAVTLDGDYASPTLWDEIVSWKIRKKAFTVSAVRAFFMYKRGNDMPTKPKRPCSHPGCPKLSDDSYCTEHKKLSDQIYNKYRRDPETVKRYGRTWKRIRDRFIAAHPLCEECKKHNILTPAQEVHHIKPLADGGTHDEDNLMALCTPCHSGITLGENNRKR